MASRMEQLLTALANGETMDFTPMTRNEAIIKRIMENGTGGGGGAASDWNAAEGEPGHVLNRPFYEEVQTITLFEQEITITGNQFGIPGQIGLEHGKTYTVLWDGVEYTCEAYETPYQNTTAVIMGNLAIAGLEENTGEPFIILDLETGYIGFATIADGTYNVSVRGEVTEVHKIPEKYIPEPEKCKVRFIFPSSVMDNTIKARFDSINESELIVLRFTHGIGRRDMYLTQSGLNGNTFIGFNPETGKLEKITFPYGSTNTVEGTLEEI